MSRLINRIIVHCSATRPEQHIGADEIRSWHIAKGWRDIGYNAVIRRSGVMEPGRDLDDDGDWLEEVGAHAAGFNSDSIGICLVGGINEDWEPDMNFTPDQMITLRKTINTILSVPDDVIDASIRFPPGGPEIIGHRDLPGVKKACPCFDVETWWRLCGE